MDENRLQKTTADDLEAILRQEPAVLRVKKRILIVEDEEINRQILGIALEDGYEILQAENGAEAMDLLRSSGSELDLMLLDLRMPVMSGTEVLHAMMADEELRRIPVIVLTADQEAEVACLQAGAMDFIPKPYPKPAIIRARVNKCIELSEKRDLIQSTERDGLTGLYNFDYFLRYVEMMDRYYADTAMDALVMDINRFRLINERYGKRYGDGVLRRLGERVRVMSRELGGVGCRRGVDTFLIYCPHRDNYKTLPEQLAEGVAGDGAETNLVHLRLGVYSEVDKTLDIERRFDFAKVASDSIRGNYSASVAFYDRKMHEAELYGLRLLEDFRTSIEQKRFLVYFQPKYDIRPEKPLLASAEALVRWDHPELGIISPGMFIPLLEDNGLVVELDRYVWRETAEQISRWKERFGFAVPVSVNVSRVDALMPNLQAVFEGILAEYSLTTDDLMLEITESAYAEDSDQVISVVHNLRDMGFSIEMDDFGTGYSSLGMLMHLPVDVLKMDMSFIRSAFSETQDTRMIELILDVAEYLKVPVVAEGVETEQQYLALKALGCALVQGYYFSKPVPPAKFERFLLERANAQGQ